MRVLFVASRLHPNYTDSLKALDQIHGLEVLVALRAANERHEALSVSQFPDGPLSRAMIPLHRRAGLAPEQIAYRQRHPSVLWLMHFIRKHRVEIVYARRDNKPLLRTARIAALLTGAKFITYRQQILDPAKRFDRHAVYPLCVNLKNSDAPANYIPFAYDLTRLPTGVRVAPYSRRSQRPLRIMAVGKLIERKGHQLLLEAAARLKERLPIQISIYGAYSAFHEQKFGQELTTMIADYDLQDCVTLMPKVSPNDMMNEYHKHHLFVYSGWVRPARDPDEFTYGRANGRCGTRLNSLVEAMAAGLPVVCASEKHVVGAVDIGRNGLVFEKRDAADLALKIETISEMNLQAMGTHSRDLVAKHYNVDKFAQKFVGLAFEKA